MSDTFSIDPRVTIPVVVPSGTPTKPARRPPFRILVSGPHASALGEDIHELPNSFDVDARTFRAAGLGPVAELAFTVRAARTVSASPEIATSVSTRFLSETAKLRALREVCPGVRITAVGDPSDLSSEDVETNRIRIALQGAIGVWGGADAVCALAHNEPVLGNTDEDAARHAVGVLRLLRHESHVDFPLDPLAGSGTVEAATAALVDATQSLLAVLDERDGDLPDGFAEEDRAWLAGPRNAQDHTFIRVGETHNTGGAS